ncbi:E3 ubiquitin-protein ligase BIG BROTHER-like isoform X1 [Punica granatum]|uniref:E3 ubiquitin-protein ligase BIG BROTHER-like isoform X1 n=1 Tax=Punica granatum TaxID=22663 RepID=A0A218WAI9_PUNGR|nr:E3 ubiquitin-protein ligase BIG BROTHER-like isoform X1 [Punica granatum]OWM69805.1 hypothetical protein CDL15_Pgr025654 [Punica granatum]
MASMLPGVGVAPRRRPLPARQGDHLGCSGRDYLRERTDPTSSPLDETALMARRRLEQKLGYLHPSSRTVKDHRQQGVDGGNKNRSGAKASSRMLISRTWNLGFGRLHKSERKVCAVCLDDFRVGEHRVMDLSCSHKYHTECLLPWIANHPHCPCCRTPI